MGTASDEGGMRLVDESAGVGELAVGERRFSGIRYEVRRFQGIAPSGLPVPGLHRIEGRVTLDGSADLQALARSNCTLHLEDGRTMALTLIDEEGRVLAEGHGPSRCHCC